MHPAEFAGLCVNCYQFCYYHGACFVDISCGNLPNACSRQGDRLVDGIELVVQLWTCVGRSPEPLHYRVQDLLYVRRVQHRSIHSHFLHVPGDGWTHS